MACDHNTAMKQRKKKKTLCWKWFGGCFTVCSHKRNYILSNWSFSMIYHLWARSAACLINICMHTTKSIVFLCICAIFQINFKQWPILNSIAMIFCTKNTLNLMTLPSLKLLHFIVMSIPNHKNTISCEHGDITQSIWYCQGLITASAYLNPLPWDF